MGSDFRKGRPLRGKFSATTRLIVKVANMEVSKHHYPEDEENRETVALTFRGLGMNKSFYWNLSYLTEQELDAIQTAFISTFDAARPICRKRDKEALDAYEAGDDSDPRIYRAAPHVVDRERGKHSHSALLSQRSEAVPSSEGSVGDTDGPLRGGSSDVAEPQPPNVEREDNPAT
jgi:hypothetical protein